MGEDNKSKDSVKIGDIITAYRKGYYRVVSIRYRFYSENDFKWLPEDRKGADGTYVINDQRVKVGDEFSPLVGMTQVFSDHFAPYVRDTVYWCDMSYCQRVTEEGVRRVMEQLEQNLSLLLAMVQGGV